MCMSWSSHVKACVGDGVSDGVNDVGNHSANFNHASATVFELNTFVGIRGF
jgi:hypothetical protein